MSLDFGEMRQKMVPDSWPESF